MRDAWTMRQMGGEMRLHEVTLQFDTVTQTPRRCQQHQKDHEDHETVWVQKHEETVFQKKQELREDVGGHTSKG